MPIPYKISQREEGKSQATIITTTRVQARNTHRSGTKTGHPRHQHTIIIIQHHHIKYRSPDSTTTHHPVEHSYITSAQPSIHPVKSYYSICATKHLSVVRPEPVICLCSVLICNGHGQCSKRMDTD